MGYALKMRLPSIAIGLLLAACSSDSTTSTTTSENFLGSCDTRTVAGNSVGQCRDWVGSSNADLSVSCDGLNGTFRQAEKCPVDGRVGTCALAPKLGLSAQYGYYGTEYTEASAEADCDGLNGVFRPASGSGGTSGTGGAGGGGGTSSGGSAGANGNGGAAGGGGKPSCPPECLRAYECVKTCGDTPVNNGCCQCPEGTIDAITCAAD